MGKIDFNSMLRDTKSKEVESNIPNALQESYEKQWGTQAPVTKVASGETIVKVPIDKLKPFKDKKGRKQPFKIDKQKVASLVASMKDVGLITPLVVRPYEDGYQILSGHHRFKAKRTWL